MAAATVAVAAALLGTAPAQAAPTPITGGAGLDWGVKQSWRTYIGADGTFLSEGVTRNADGTFHFPVTGGSYEPGTGTTVVSFGGTLLFLGHCEGAGPFERPCALDMTLRAPRVEITEDGAFLYATMASRPIAGGSIPESREVRLAALDAEDATPVVTATTTAWSGLPARMTEPGSEIFTYGVGTVIDPISFGYDGPGGKPAGEQWSEPGAPAYHREALPGGSSSLPRLTLPGRTADELFGIHMGTSVGISLIDRRTFAPVPGSHLASNIGSFGSFALDPVSATAFAGRTGASAHINARHWDGNAWIDDPVADSVVPGAGVGAGAWDPVGNGRYLLARTVSGVTQLWQTRRVDGAWTASNLGTVKLTTGLPAPLLQQIVSVPDGNPATQRMLLSTWHGQVHRLHLLADGVVAEPLPQAGAFTASRLIPVRDGLYLVNATSVAYLPLTGAANNRRLGNAESAIAIPSPNGLATYDTGFVSSDFERNQLFVASHDLTKVTRIEAGRVRHAFSLPGQRMLNYFASFLPGATSDGDPVVLNDGGELPPADALVYDSAAPSFTTQPADTAIALPAGVATAPASFTVAVDGDPSPSVRWQSRVPGVSGWADLTAADGATGFDGQQLTVTAGAGHGGRQYRAIATSSAGAVASERVTIEVKTPPAVSVQPDSISVLEGSPALFKAMPTGNPEPAISWQQRVGGFWREVDEESGDFTLDGGFLTVNDPIAAMSGTQFRARLRNEVGTVYTRAVTLTVDAALTAPVSFGGGFVTWGISERWRCYVVGSIARGGIEVSGGVEKVAGTLASGSLCAGRNAGSEALRFLVRGGSYDPASGRLEVALDGAVRFWGHDYHVPGSTTPQLDTRFSKLKVVVENGVGTISADAVGATMESPAPRAYGEVALASIELAGVSPARTAGGLAWPAAPTTLTAGGAAVFGSYTAGEPFDPIALDLVIGEPRRDPAPTPDPVPTTPPVPAPLPLPLPAPAPRSTPAAPAPAFTVPRRALLIGSARTAKIATIACQRGAACAIATPSRVRFAIAGRRFTASVVAPRRVAAGERAVVRLTLTKAAAKRLAGRSATVRVRVTVTRAGRRTQRTVTVKLRAASAKRAARR